MPIKSATWVKPFTTVYHRLPPFVLLQGFNLFSSEEEDYASAKNLMFKDSATGLVKVPPNTDSFLYLGAEYTSIIRSLKRGITHFSLISIVLHYFSSSPLE